MDRKWMPWTLRAPFLCSLAALLLFMFVAIEGLRQYSNRHQGLVLFKNSDELPTGLSTAYVYVPTAMAVLAASLWNFCAFDILRLEPYFQLAKPHGAPATVLFTNYSFCYGFLAPLMAARSRHWIVLCVSTLSLIMRMFLPSLLSGLIGLDDITIVQKATVNTWPEFIDLQTQTAWLLAEARRPHSAVTVTADDAYLFRCPDYATAAVAMPDSENDSFVLSVKQPVYWADLDCRQVALRNLDPKVTSAAKLGTDWSGDSLWSWNITGIEIPSAGRASCCRLDVAVDSVSSNSSSAFQVQYWEPVHSQSLFNSTSAFNVSGCESFALFGVFLDVEKVDSSTGSGYTSSGSAFACSAAYQYVEAKVFLAPDPYVSAIEIDTLINSDLSNSSFNSTAFQDLLYSRSRTRANATVELPDGTVDRYIHPKLIDIDTAAQTQSQSPVVRSSRAQSNVTAYQQAISQFWKKKFVVIIDKSFDPTAAPTAVEATETMDVVALVVTPKTAIISETVLLAAGLLLLALAYIYPRRLNILHNDPGSIAAQCAMIVDSFAAENVLAQANGHFHQATTRQLRTWAKDFWCRWTTSSSGEKQIEIVPLMNQDAPCEPLSLPVTRRRRDPIPHFLLVPWFLGEAVLLAAALLAFCFSLKFIRLSNINHLSKGEDALLEFLIYGPTIVSSMVSTLLASILRHISVLEPWVRLQDGMAAAAQSIAMNYGSQTPFSVLWKSWRQGPLLLTVLAVVSILNLLLAVISGGIFEPQVKDYRTPATFSPKYRDTVFLAPAPDVNFDGYSLISSKLTAGDVFVPWVDTNTSFLPLSVTAPADDYDEITYEAVTRGISAGLECTQVSYSQSRSETATGDVFWNYTTPSGALCTVPEPRGGQTSDGVIERSIRYLVPSTDNSTAPACRTSIFLLARWNTTDTAALNSSNSIALYCTPNVVMQNYLVEFDDWGTIHAYSPAAAQPTLDEEMLRNASHNLAQFNRAIVSFGRKFQLHAHLHLHHHQQQTAGFYLYDWPGMLTEIAYKTLDPSSSSMNATALIQATQSTYPSIFSTYFSLTRDLYFERHHHHQKSPAPAEVKGTLITRLWGMIPSTASMAIIIALLSVDITLLVVVFATRYNHFQGPRVPKSIGSLIPWVARSRMRDGFRGMSRVTGEELADRLGGLGRRYVFERRVFSGDGEKRWMLDWDGGDIELDSFESNEQEGEEREDAL